MYKADSTARSCQYYIDSSHQYGYFESNCEQNGLAPGLATGKINNCDKIYVKLYGDVVFKYIYDRWVTTIIFACFIIACDIGLAIFGFFLFKSDTPGI